MDKFKDMARVIAAIESGHGKPVFNLALVSEEALGIPEERRDDAAMLLYKNGYIEGLRIVEGIDGQRMPHIFWDMSSPNITLKGYEFIDENQPLKKAFKALSKLDIPTAMQVLSNTYNKFAK